MNPDDAARWARLGPVLDNVLDLEPERRAQRIVRWRRRGVRPSSPSIANRLQN